MKPGLFSRWFGRREERSAEFGVSPVWQGTWTGTRHVNAYIAENLSGVSACVHAISSAIASLPPIIYRVSDTGRTELTGHPLNRLIASPWGAMTWPDFCEWAMSQVLLNGNCLAEIISDNAGRAVELRPIPWSYVSPVVLPSGRMAFDVSLWPEPRRRLLLDECFYLKDRSDNAFTGRSRISRSPDVIGNAASLQDFSAHAWENQAAPSGAVEIQQPLTSDQYERLRARFDNRYTGAHNARKVLILDSSAKWSSISVSPEDAEVLASRRFSTEELCRLFGVPPPIVQDYTHNTFTNSQQASLWFAQFSLLPWVRKIEAEFQRSVIIGSDVQLELDMSGLTRGDFTQRWQAYAIARQNGILSVDEIRSQEGYSPAPPSMMQQQQQPTQQMSKPNGQMPAGMMQ